MDCAQAFRDSGDAQREDVFLLQADLHELASAAGTGAAASQPEELATMLSMPSLSHACAGACSKGDDTEQLLPPPLDRVYVAVKRAEARLWQERMQALQLSGDGASSVPRHALDARQQATAYPPEFLLRY